MASKEDVLKVARLARLKIQDSELEKVQQKFAAILEHFNVLQEVNTRGIEPLFHAVDSMTLRPDEPEAPIPVETLMANAPDHFENSFRIPRVVGGEE